MKARSLLLSLCACGLIASAPSQAASYSSIYIFGDSLADTGNNAWVFDNALPVIDPTNSTGFAFQRTEAPITAGNDEVDGTLVPTFPYTSNRYSNGGVWPDYVSAMTGLPTVNALSGVSFTQLYGFLSDPANNPPPPVTGTNFAFGGARVGTTPPLGFPFSLVDQVSAYALLLNGNPAPSDALFIVEGGGNDLRDAFAAAMDGDPLTDPLVVINDYLTGMGTVLNTLAYLGAQHIAVWNLPDLGLVPAVQALGDDAMFSAWLGSMIMNGQLDSLLDSFDAIYDGDLFRFDLFGTMHAIVLNAWFNGLTNVSSACALDAACVADPTGYLFWDGIHPTTFGHYLLAQAFLEAVPIERVPEPATLWLMLIALLPAAFGRRFARS